ncbi:hypothetical protein AQ490_15845 [Wenjunlia vitaminophila]|uniref:TauD/TfdA-like domain-containing protein n=1 Tax=Wenjunlia vitaminophila TaxID=76728 RepID=A0A0T6LXB2_WENVI|nr:hypothetical protein AQ490_15845 [Wenjunlia vitaminophila]
MVVLRGFDELPASGLADYARSWGALLTWDFGEVLELVNKEGSGNYLMGSGPVPFHWDGAFAGRAPSYLLFRCALATQPGTGGETSFCDTTRVLRQAPPERQRLWERVRITYRIGRTGHFGGTTSSPLVVPHPLTGHPTLRYAEPLPAEEFENPMTLGISGIPAAAREDLLGDLRERLYRGGARYSHRWQTGDYVLADNHTLLHRREPYRRGASRHLQRVHIL